DVDTAQIAVDLAVEPACRSRGRAVEDTARATFLVAADVEFTSTQTMQPCGTSPSSTVPEG
ncbi:hypothetical protein, partial [Streptomyces sp. NPDC056405]|uniref:hypothetical protein n=1 Tax=Streptomyces sp. NPDC056405 TaxID=3345811 RepID=UPI0035E342CA